jgi:hypothetical protein
VYFSVTPIPTGCPMQVCPLQRTFGCVSPPPSSFPYVLALVALFWNIIPFFFQDGFDVICKRTDEGMDTCKTVLKFFSKRSELEKEYSKSLSVLITKYSGRVNEAG